MISNFKSALVVLCRVNALAEGLKLAGREWRKRQATVLSECLESASKRVPYYRGLREEGAGKDAPGSPELADFPILTKAIAKGQFPDGLVAEGHNWEELYPVATSGTTDRVMTFEDEERRNWDRAADLLIQWGGNRFRPGHRSLSFPPDACYEHCGADGRMIDLSVAERFKGWRSAPPEQRRQAGRNLRSKVMSEYVWRSRRVPSLGVDGTGASEEILESYCRELSAWKPRVISGLPVTLYVLALYAARRGYAFPFIETIRPNGAKFSEVMIRTIEATFDAKVRENYGTAELCTVACDCEHTRDQHLLGEIFCLEFLRNGEAVEPGTLGELVVTDMRNRVTPLIRYAVGDVGRFKEGRCACGFEGTRFVVDGRMEETVVTPEGKAVSGTQIVDLFLGQPGIDHVKIHQQSDELFLVEAVPSPDGGDTLYESQLAAELSELLGREVSIKLRQVRRISPERNGKYRLVISKSWERFHEV